MTKKEPGFSKTRRNQVSPRNLVSFVRQYTSGRLLTLLLPRLPMKA